MRKYEEIYDQLYSQIEAGHLLPGARLPSVRTLSRQFGVSKSTILQALDKLEKGHLIYAIEKSGFYVLEHAPQKKPASHQLYDFKTASPAWHAFPYQDFQQCLHQSIAVYKEELFAYGTPQGLRPLIEEARRLLADVQVFCKEEQIHITAGVQQALFVLSQMPFPNQGTCILVEEPTYHYYLEMLRMYKMPVVGIRRGLQGVDLDELEQLFKSGRIKFFYTMPRYHNPLGASYSKKQMQAILSLAEAHQVFIVEDDFLADFEYRPRIDPMHAMDVNENVIYLKSLSKIIFPGLRTGFAVLPDVLAGTFQKHKHLLDLDSSMVSQAGLAIYLKSGMFEKHKKRIVQVYQQKAKILHEALQLHMPEFERAADLAMHTHVKLPPQVNVRALEASCRDKGILIESADAHFVQKPEKLLKLNVSNIREERIEEGIQLLAAELFSAKNRYP